MQCSHLVSTPEKRNENPWETPQSLSAQTTTKSLIRSLKKTLQIKITNCINFLTTFNVNTQESFYKAINPSNYAHMCRWRLLMIIVVILTWTRIQGEHIFQLGQQCNRWDFEHLIDIFNDVIILPDDVLIESWRFILPLSKAFLSFFRYFFNFNSCFKSQRFSFKFWKRLQPNGFELECVS